MFFYDALDRQVNSTTSDIVVQMLYKGEDHGEENNEDQDGFDLLVFAKEFEQQLMLDVRKRNETTVKGVSDIG